jgi:phage terminase small subunit
MQTAIKNMEKEQTANVFDYDDNYDQYLKDVAKIKEEALNAFDLFEKQHLQGDFKDFWVDGYIMGWFKRNINGS